MNKGNYIENNEVHHIRNVFIGVNGVARIIKAAYVGINGKARQIFRLIVVHIPILSGVYAYNKTEQSVNITNLEAENVNVSGTLKATNAGEYQVVFSLRGDDRVWENGAYNTIIKKWVINKASLPVPFVIDDIVYDGLEHTAPIANYDSETMNLSGAVSGAEPGEYTTTITLKDKANYLWDDQTIDDKSLLWQINKITLAVPKVRGSYTYTGEQINVNIDGYDPETMETSKWPITVLYGLNYYDFYIKDFAHYKWDSVVGRSFRLYVTVNKKSVSTLYLLTRRLTMTEAGVRYKISLRTTAYAPDLSWKWTSPSGNHPNVSKSGFTKTSANLWEFELWFSSGYSGTFKYELLFYLNTLTNAEKYTEDSLSLNDTLYITVDC